jgi:fumarate hydratase subunit beta
MRVFTPLSEQTIGSLKCGSNVLLNGIIYTARDAAHKRMVEALAAGEDLPFKPEGQVIYFVGPTPAPPGRIIGSAGPTTSGRMDAYSPILLKKGLRGLIGKGPLSAEVLQVIKETGSVYFGAIGGAGALLSSCIKKVEVLAYPELGPEAIHKLEVEDLPAIVLVDCYGNNLYELGRAKYQLT